MLMLMPRLTVVQLRFSKQEQERLEPVVGRVKARLEDQGVKFELAPMLKQLIFMKEPRILMPEERRFLWGEASALTELAETPPAARVGEHHVRHTRKPGK